MQTADEKKDVLPTKQEKDQCDIKEVKMKIGIIGAGAAGLVAIKSCIQEGYECEAFEQTEFIGGTWNYTDEVGVDKYGLPVHTSMYKNLRTNLPKEVMMFEDFPYPETLKQSYITQSEVLKYLNNYAEQMDLKKHIKFLKLVTSVEPVENDKWDVEIKDVVTKLTEKKRFDAIIICNGKYEVPYIPKIPGMETFTGNCIHSHNYRSSEPYKDKVVLVIGAGPSGIDISSNLHKVAKKVVISFKSSPYDFHLPDGPVRVSRIQKIDKCRVLFEDALHEDVDEIILCTGFLYNFPFLSEKCNISSDDNYITGLYKECLCIEFPTMFIVGLPGAVCPIPTFELQMRFFSSFLNGRFTLPSKKKMLEENENKRKNKICTNRRFHTKGVKGEREYWDELSETASVSSVPVVISKIHKWVISNKKDGSLCFRIMNDDEFEMTA